MVEAEISRLCGDDLKAMNYYDIAIESAGAGGFIQNEAIANELAGRFWMERKKEHFASIYLTRAWEGYVKWHARRKADNVLQKYGNVVRTGESTNLRYFTIAPTVADQVLDIASVVKSSQAISKEISLEKLLTQLMNIIIENAGAQRGYLLLRTNGDLRIEASASAEEKAIEVLQSVALEDSSFLSKSVERKGKNLGPQLTDPGLRAKTYCQRIKRLFPSPRITVTPPNSRKPLFKCAL